MDKIVVVGGGGHAKVVISILKKCATYSILGYTDLIDNGSLLGVEYLGDDAVLEGIVRERPKCLAILGVGYVAISDIRKRLAERLGQLGFQSPVVMSPRSIVNEDVSIGQGTVICDAAVINSGTNIGKHCIVNTNSTIDHDCEIGDFVHIAPGVTLGGGNKVGSHVMIGAGVTIIQYKTVSENCLIGAGAVVTNDCLVPGTYVGCPARLKD
jgi:UDP-perosamine 4-acetyltransferase